MKYSVRFFTTTFCFCLILLSHVCAEPIEFTFNGTHWKGDTETIVSISTRQGMKIGNIIELTPYHIKLEQKNGKTILIDKNSIQAIVPVNEKVDTTSKDQSIKDNTTPPDKASEILPIVYAIHLTGNVGYVFGDDSVRQSWYSASMIRDCFKVAKNKKAESFILEITSDGGHPAEANSICELIQEYRDDFKIIAYPHRVQGPATGIVMTCDTIISAPDSRIGPDSTASGNANLREYYTNADRDSGFINAFGNKKSELHYSSKTNSFSSSTSVGSTEVDGEFTSLVLNSSDLVKYGISERSASSIDVIPLTKSNIMLLNNKLLGNHKKAKLSILHIQKEIAKIFSETYDKKHRCKLEKYCYSPHPPPYKFTISDMMRELVCRIKKKGETERFYRDTSKIAKNIRKIIVGIRMTADRIVKSDINGNYPFQLGSEALCNVKTAANFGEEVLVDSKILGDDPRTTLRVDRLLKQFVRDLGSCSG